MLFEFAKDVRRGVSAVGPQHDLDAGAHAIAQQVQQGKHESDSVVGRVDMARTQVKAQGCVEGSQGERERVVADRPEVAVVHAALLVAVDLDLGGVQIDVQALGHALAAQEGMERGVEQAAPEDAPVGAQGEDPRQESVEGGLAREQVSQAVLRPRGEAGAQDRIVAQSLRVHHVGQAEHDAVDREPQQGRQAVEAVGGSPRVEQRADQAGEEGRALLELPKEDHAPKGGEGVIPNFYAQRLAERGTVTHEAHVLALPGTLQTRSWSANRAPIFVPCSGLRGISGIRTLPRPTQRRRARLVGGVNPTTM